MKLYSTRQFVYPGWLPRSRGCCRLAVYRDKDEVLVLLRDHYECGGPSLTNAFERAAEAVHGEVLRPLGLEGLPTRWVYWEAADGAASEVVFQDPIHFRGPSWKYLSPEALRELLRRFGGEEDLEASLQAGEVFFRRGAS